MSQTEIQQQLVNDCCRWLEADDRVLAVWLVGSLARGAGDRFSDIDLYVVVRDADYDAVYGERGALARRLGDVLSTFEVEWPSCQMLGVILKNGIEIDLCYCRIDQCEIFKPGHQYRILFDRSDQLEERLREPVVHDDDPVNMIRRHIGFAHYDFLHAIHGLARGELWASIHHVECLRARLIDLLARSLDVEFNESKGMERHLEAEDQKRLAQTLCSYDAARVQQAIELLVDLFGEQLELLSLKHGTDFGAAHLSHWNDYLRLALATGEGA